MKTQLSTPTIVSPRDNAVPRTTRGGHAHPVVTRVRLLQLFVAATPDVGTSVQWPDLIVAPHEGCDNLRIR
jgi:hypothetical protein